MGPVASGSPRPDELESLVGAATVFMSARQLGHSVAVAERHYLGVHRGIPKDAHTLEAAMQIEEAMRRVPAMVADSRLPIQVFRG